MCKYVQMIKSLMGYQRNKGSVSCMFIGVIFTFSASHFTSASEPGLLEVCILERTHFHSKQK